MQNNRRQFRRKRITGVALIECEDIAGTSLIDLGLGGMKVFSKTALQPADALWVDLTLLRSDYKVVLGRRARAKLVHSELDNSTGRYTLGFKFLELTEHQRDLINNVLSS